MERTEIIKKPNESTNDDIQDEEIDELYSSRYNITKEPEVQVQISEPLSPELSPKTLYTKKALPSPQPSKGVQFQFPENEKKLSGILRSQSNLQLNARGNLSPKLKPAVSFDSINVETQKEEQPEYMYQTITKLTTQRSLEEVRAGVEVRDVASLPEKCIVERKIKKPLEEDSDDESEFDEHGRRRPPKIKKKIVFYETRHYINSQEFFKHFGDVFQNIYNILGFSKSALAEATSQGSIIYINLEEASGNLVGYEVYPAVSTAWPELAFEWLLRTRNLHNHPHVNKPVSWPREKTINKIRSMSAVVLPVGYMAKRGVNEAFDLEWSLAFPSAERYLETCLTHAQVRCYLFILTIFKTFVEAPNPKLGLSPHHIRTVIFWECERNWTTWQEENLGSKMLLVLKKIYECLGSGKLPDYFVRDRNLLESTPSRYLHISQEKFHKILERPLFYTLIAIRNLRYTSGSFFPTLDIKELYKIITTRNALVLVNPGLANMLANTEEGEEDDGDEFNVYTDREKDIWTKEQERDDLELKWKRKLRKQIETDKKEVKKNLKNERKDSVDSIDVQVSNFNT